MFYTIQFDEYSLIKNKTNILRNKSLSNLLINPVELLILVVAVETILIDQMRNGWFVCS